MIKIETLNDNKTMERAKVIAALRYCASGKDCNGCPLDKYDGVTCAGFSDMLKKAANLLERDAEPPNDPLTMEELRGMDGEPVYIRRLQDFDGFWIVIRASARNKLTTDYGGYFELADYGKTWLAYRCKPAPEEGEQNV